MGSLTENKAQAFSVDATRPSDGALTGEGVRNSTMDSTQVSVTGEDVPDSAMSSTQISSNCVMKHFACMNTLVYTFRRDDDSGVGGDVRLQLVFQSSESRQKHEQHIRVDIHGKGDAVYEQANQVADLHGPILGIHVESGAIEDGVVAIFDMPAGEAEDMGSLAFIKKPAPTPAADALHAGTEEDWKVVDGQFEVLQGGRRLRGSFFTRTFSYCGIACCKVQVATHCVLLQKDQYVVSTLLISSGRVPIPFVDVVKGSKLSRDEKREVLRECRKGFKLHNLRVFLKCGDQIELTLVKYHERKCEVVKTEAGPWKHTANNPTPDSLLVPKDLTPDEELLMMLNRNDTKREPVADPFTLDDISQQKALKYFPTLKPSDKCQAQGCGKKFDLWSRMWTYIECGGPRHCDFCGMVFCSEHLEPYDDECCGINAQVCRNCAELLGVQDDISVAENDSTPQGVIKNHADDSSPLLQPPSTPLQDSRNYRVVVFASSLKASDGVNEEPQVICDAMGPGDLLVYQDMDKFKVASKLNASGSGKREVLHFAGHGQDGKRLLFQPETSGEDPKSFAYDNLVRLIHRQHGVECVFLNACRTLELGKRISDGVAYVICWGEYVSVRVAVEFARKFYIYLKDNPGEYGTSFDTVCSAIQEEYASSIPGNPCILHNGVFPETDSKFADERGRSRRNMCWSQQGLVDILAVTPASTDTHIPSNDDDEGFRNWGPIGKQYDKNSNSITTRDVKFHYSAKAGAKEMQCLECLGVVMEYNGIKIATDNANWNTGPNWHGLNRSGFVDNAVLQHLVNGLLPVPTVTHYEDLWGAGGWVVERAKACAEKDVVCAIKYLDESVKYRTSDMVKRRGANTPRCANCANVRKTGVICRFVKLLNCYV